MAVETQTIGESGALRFRVFGGGAGITWITIAVIVLTWAAFALWARDLRVDSRRDTEQALVRQRALVEEHVEGVFKVAETYLTAANRWIIDHPGRDPRTDPSFAQLAIALTNATHETMLMRLVDSEGILSFVPAVRGAGGISVTDRDYFHETIKTKPGTVFVSAPYMGRTSGRWLIAAAMRLQQPSQGATIAFISIEVGLFDEVFERARLGDGGSISLFRKDGVLLARSATRRGDLGKNISQGTVFSKGVARSSSGLIETDGRQVDGVPRLVAFGELKSFPLVVTSGIAIDAIDKQARLAILRVAGILLAVSVIAFVARWKIVTLLGELAASRERLTHETSHDALTGGLNRRAFCELADAAVRHAARLRAPVSLVVVDPDQLRRLNERHGRQAGDLALRSCADICRTILRQEDLFGRLDGSEFCIVMPGLDMPAAFEVAERIRQAVAVAALAHGDASLRCTISAGVTTFGSADGCFDDLYARASRALKRAKDEGRDRVASEAPRLALKHA